MIVLGLIAGGAYLWYTNGRPTSDGNPRSTSGPTVTPTPNPTAGWKTYTNTAHHYSIKYPPTISFGEYDKGAEGTLVIFNTAENIRTIEAGTGVFGISVQSRQDSSLPILSRTTSGGTIPESEVTKYTLAGIEGEQWARPSGPIVTGVISSGTKYLLSIQSSDMEAEYRQMLQTFTVLK